MRTVAAALAGILAALWLLDGFRLRRRLAGLPVLRPSEEPAAADHRFVSAPGVSVDEATRRAASAHARREGLDLLGLVPGNAPTLGLVDLIWLVDPRRYQEEPFAKGETAGCALLATEDVLRRARADGAEFPRLARRLKLYAGRGGLALAPELCAAPENPTSRRERLVAAVGPIGVNVVLVAEGLTLGLIGAGLVLAPPWGLAALAAYHLQILITLAGQAERPPDLLLVTLLRTPVELARWLGTVRSICIGGEPDPVQERRAAYAEELAGGLDRFHEPSRPDCPLCGARALAMQLRTVDLLQHKPGCFTLQRCLGCGHIFQNPRLSPAGLEFYYRDFYDGLGETASETIFEAAEGPYRARARAVVGPDQPRRWLDVGTGHGHFCRVARQVWPETGFDGLDLSASVEEAARRRWVARGLRGLFPELAPELAGQYDVVSMSHYLEHTIEPRAELRAARTALGPGGLLLIEVPDPDCRLGRWLGRFWFPWLQPQHLHLLSVRNLERLLRAEGFTPLVWQRGEAHLPAELAGAALLLLRFLGPPTDVPWRSAASRGERIRHHAVWGLGLPLLAVAGLLDRALAPACRRPGWSNAYRVLARRA